MSWAPAAQLPRAGRPGHLGLVGQGLARHYRPAGLAQGGAGGLGQGGGSGVGRTGPARPPGLVPLYWAPARWAAINAETVAAMRPMAPAWPR